MPKIYFYSLILVTIIACHPEDNRNMAKFREEMESRKLQRVTEGQLIEYATRIGKVLLDTNSKISNTEFFRKVDSAYGIALKYYQLHEIPLKTKLAEISDAYIYNQQNGIVSEDNLQKQGDSVLIYTRPVLTNNSLTGIYTAIIQKKKLIKKYSDKTVAFEF